MTRTATEIARPVAIHLVEKGAGMAALTLAAQFGVFMDHNADEGAAMIREGYTPEQVADEMMAAFRVFVAKQAA